MLLQFHCSLRSPSWKPKNAMAMANNSSSSLTVKRVVPRRLFIGFSSILLEDVCPLLAAPLPERTRKLASGVRIQDIIQGEGPEAKEGDVVQLNYVCRRSNGYFVHSTVDQFTGESMPVILALDENQIIKGLKEVLIGMRAGGKRRALIPPSMGYVNGTLKPIPDEFGPRRSLFSHTSEPLIFEMN